MLFFFFFFFFFCYSLPSLSVFWGVILKTFSVVFMIQCIPIFSRGCITTISVGSRSPQLHFVEAVDDDDEFRDMGGNNSANDIFLTLATDFLTEAPALEHLFLNSARPNFVAPVLSSL
jgi:hypothetical protein